MPGRWTAAAYTSLMVALYVADAQVQVSEGAAIEVTAVRVPANKGDWRDLAAAHTPLPAAKGDSLPDHVPTLTVLR
jgi:hypothetical protein